MRCTFVLHRCHCAVSSTLIFSCEFSTNRYLTGKRSHLAKGTSIFCNCSGQFSSRYFPNIYSCCSLSFPSFLTWISAPMDVHNQRCRKLLFSDVFMHYVPSLVFPRECASWVTCNLCSWVWTWNEILAIRYRRQGRKGLLVLCFLMLLFCRLF